jgi:hypothetical protein
MNKKIRINEKNLSRLKKLIREEITLQEQKQLNEGIMDVIGGVVGNAAGGLIENLKNRFARFVLERIGINPDGVLASVAINVFENLELSEVWALVQGDRSRCPLIARELLEAIGETMFEKMPEMLGYQPQGWIATTLREMSGRAIFRNNEVIARVSQSICDLDLSRLLQSAGASSEQAEQLQQAVRSGATAPTSQAAQVQEAKKRLNKILFEAKRNKK